MAKTLQQPKDPGSTGFAHTYDWKLYPETESFLQKELAKFLRKNAFAKKIARQLQTKTSTRLFDWVDHLVLPGKTLAGTTLKKLQFKRVTFDPLRGIEVYRHPKAVFFPILLGKSDISELALKTEYLDDAVKKLGDKARIEGKRYVPYRKVILHTEGNTIVAAVERRGTNSFWLEENSRDANAYRKALRLFSTRKRTFTDERKGLLEVARLIANTLRTLSPARTTDAFFRAERIYWQRHNKTARQQRTRQDLLGLGWGNHDHHTYRSSRKNFVYLIKIFERLGFVCRERFFAGEKAGWGAQILEHPDCGIVVFADVDVTHKEKDTDFAHHGLQGTRNLGTVGLWVALHGESILQSGLHHLAAHFIFTRIKHDLSKAHLEFMHPFSNFPFLKQAFSKAELWRVAKTRLTATLGKGAITLDQYKTFQKRGALGSHLENIQRRQGFKGFNQDSVTAIIQATDPRKQ